MQCSNQRPQIFLGAFFVGLARIEALVLHPIQITRQTVGREDRDL